jgi:hypothetical protein
MNPLRITLIGGPTALIEIEGFRILTDPTFDAPGAYQLPHVKLEKLSGPALEPEAIGKVDAVLLSHDQHADNLDHSGKDFLTKADRVLTTVAGREAARRPRPRSCALGDHRTDRQQWPFPDRHRDARASWPRRYRTAVRRRHRLRADLERQQHPSDLHQRRYGLV